MNYADALAVMEKDAPNLKLDPQVEGQRHVVIRDPKNTAAAPFSVMLPDDTDNKEGEAKMFADALDQAKKHHGVE